MHTAKLNERYYARNDVPKSGQFKNNYQFYDDTGRLYKIGTVKSSVFQDKRFRSGGQRNPLKEPLKKPLVNGFSQVTLYVKRPHSNTPWFGYHDVGRAITLYDARDGAVVGEVKLRAYDKPREAARVGTIRVSGLSRLYCEERLNASDPFFI